MPSAWTIRPLSGAGEAHECARLMAASEPWITLGRTVDSSLAVLTDPRKEVHVATDAQGVAAFIILDLHGPFPGYIQTVYVRPDCRGRGLGTEIIRFAEERIFRDSPNVFLCVSSFNPEARRLYDRLGYELVGVLRAYVVPEHDELLMRKSRASWTEFRASRRAT